MKALPASGGVLQSERQFKLVRSYKNLPYPNNSGIIKIDLTINSKQMPQNKIIALVLNCIIPGAGTIMAGKKKVGIIQLILAGLALLMIITVIGALLGIPLALGVWIWSIISVATMDNSEFEKK